MTDLTGFFCVRLKNTSFNLTQKKPVTSPSRADEALTQALKQALALVDVRELDHFVVAVDSALSFAERGYFISN